MHPFRLLAAFELLRSSAATQYPLYSSDYIERHLATFLTPPEPGTKSCNKAASQIFPMTCSLSSNEKQCSFLVSAVPGRVDLGDYEEQYWSLQQSTTSPYCRVFPLSAEEVSIVIRVLKKFQCQFAVKSGGHAAFEGASNSEGGVTIDLVSLNEITTSEDQTVTSLGPGNRWIDVYRTLDLMNLSVVGGRVADIGVGGLTLGGGISFFSGRYGWACDNVVNYQVVVANGSICDVNHDTHPDLYFALRGGGNNFGIVTRFDVATFPQGDLWEGVYTFREDSGSALFDALVDFTTNAPSDPYAAATLSYYYNEFYDAYAISVGVTYGKPEINPPILQNFTSIPSVVSSWAIATLTMVAADYAASNPSGFRQTTWTLTIQNSASLIAKIVAIFKEEADSIKGVSRPALLIQPITSNMISHFSKKGGNALGISDEDGPLILLDVAIQWNSTQDDERVMNAARKIINRGNETAYSLALGHRFIYQNYAAAEQNVFPSYGAETHSKLKAVREKYDPEGVFTKLQPGYFKL